MTIAIADPIVMLILVNLAFTVGCLYITMETNGLLAKASNRIKRRR